MNERELDRRELVCLDMIRAAGAIAKEGFGASGGTHRMKGPQDFLTETDGAVERHIRKTLNEAFPEDGFLGEETGGRAAERVWVVDPIDGTANFARRIPHYCVAIAFVCDGETQLGATYNPSLDELYFARRGRGALLNGQPIKVAATSSFDSASIEVGWSPRRSNADYLRIVAGVLARGANVRRSGSGALALAYVADGRLDGYAELHMNSWDCLAGLLQVKEAGGRVGPFLSAGGLEAGAPVFAAAPGIASGLSEASGLPMEDQGANRRIGRN